MATTTVRNTTKGIRGLNTLAGYRDLAAGEVADVELSDDELASAKGTGYFEFGKAAKAEPKPEPEVEPAVPSPVETPRAADDLDAMADDDLRVTVEAITGKKPPAKATRDDLLALARAPAA